MAAWTKASAVEQSLSWSLLMRRLSEIQAKVRSATHLRGRFSKAARSGSFLTSIFRPSLNHSLAQVLRTFSGGGLGVRLTISTSKPSRSSTQSLPRPR